MRRLRLPDSRLCVPRPPQASAQTHLGETCIQILPQYSGQIELPPLRQDLMPALSLTRFPTRDRSIRGSLLQDMIGTIATQGQACEIRSENQIADWGCNVRYQGWSPIGGIYDLPQSAALKKD